MRSRAAAPQLKKITMANEENASPASDKVDELITALGGAEIEITYRDGGKETVKVRQIPVRHMDKYLLAIDNEPVAVELFCGKPAGWSDSLTEESFNAIAEKGQDINLPFFGPWLRRRMKRIEVMKPGFAATMESVIKSAIESASQSRGSSSPPA